MSDLLAADWADFNAAINDVQDTFMNKPIFWIRKIAFLDRFGEDGPAQTQTIQLKCLANYNFFRTWPITNQTESGEQDRQSVQVIFTKTYLRDLGYLNGADYFDFDPAYDRFVFDGMVCKADGDTSVSQMNGIDALFSLILRREELTQGSNNQNLLNLYIPPAPPVINVPPPPVQGSLLAEDGTLILDETGNPILL